MKTPERNAAIKMALASQPSGLPADFPVRMAGIAEARSRRWVVSMGDAALASAFIGMLGICLVGWARFATQDFPNAEWSGKLGSVVAAQPWLLCAVAGLVFIQALSFRKRATI
jgi:hypothetical protein